MLKFFDILKLVLEMYKFGQVLLVKWNVYVYMLSAKTENAH
jgi:hypothetical protein